MKNAKYGAHTATQAERKREGGGKERKGEREEEREKEEERGSETESLVNRRQ